mgnify:CR=1 FL=1
MKNYTKTNIGSEGRTELHDALALTGAEVSINRLPAGACVPFVHSHKRRNLRRSFRKRKGNCRRRRSDSLRRRLAENLSRGEASVLCLGRRNNICLHSDKGKFSRRFHRRRHNCILSGDKRQSHPVRVAFFIYCLCAGILCLLKRKQRFFAQFIIKRADKVRQSPSDRDG